MLSYIYTHTCVCVCVWSDRKRERESAREGVRLRVFTLLCGFSSWAMLPVVARLCVWVGGWVGGWARGRVSRWVRRRERYCKRDLFMLQKRPIHVAKETYTERAGKRVGEKKREREREKREQSK